MAHRITAPAMQRAQRLLDQRVQPFVRAPIPFEFLGLRDSVSSLGFTYTRYAHDMTFSASGITSMTLPFTPRSLPEITWTR